MGGKPRAFKHQLGAARVRKIGAAIADASPEFDRDAFESHALAGLTLLELKDRVRHIIDALAVSLPRPFPKAIATIRAATERDGSVRQGDDRLLRGFAAWPLIDYVGEHGQDHVALSLESLAALTELFSAEFAIRPFLDRHADQTLAAVARFATSDNEHVRRLASEGTRPLLPWGIRLSQFRADPAPVLAILETLNKDPSEYVRRSVANNLNDIAKDHPAVVVEVCRRWQNSGVDAALIRRALRTLVKKGDAGALAVLGFSSDIAADVDSLTVDPKSVREGDSVELSFELRSTSNRAQQLNIDYAVHFVKKSGARSAKVFKLKPLELGAKQRTTVRKKHSLRRVTTRVHYPGIHTVELLINGNSMATADFELLA